jgi:hypothetical protein
MPKWTAGNVVIHSHWYHEPEANNDEAKVEHALIWWWWSIHVLDPRAHACAAHSLASRLTGHIGRTTAKEKSEL